MLIIVLSLLYTVISLRLDILHHINCNLLKTGEYLIVNNVVGAIHNLRYEVIYLSGFCISVRLSFLLAISGMGY